MTAPRVFRVVGIDPGVTGGVAVAAWRPTGRMGWRVELLAPTPVRTIAGEGRTVDAWALADLLRHNEDARGLVGTIERVHGVGQQGAAASFAFGRAAGLAEAALTLAVAPWRRLPQHCRRITPQRWHKLTGTPLGRGKAASLERARELLARMGQSAMADAALARQKDDGPAEALLIALAGAVSYFASEEWAGKSTAKAHPAPAQLRELMATPAIAGGIDSLR